jgi:hypothetical protein
MAQVCLYTSGWVSIANELGAYGYSHPLSSSPVSPMLVAAMPVTIFLTNLYEISDALPVSNQNSG